MTPAETLRELIHHHQAKAVDMDCFKNDIIALIESESLARSKADRLALLATLRMERAKVPHKAEKHGDSLPDPEHPEHDFSVGYNEAIGDMDYVLDAAAEAVEKETV